MQNGPPNAAPPPWADDGLSRFLALSEYNCRAASLNYPHAYTVLRSVDTLFDRVQDSLEHDNLEVLLIPRFLFIRARSAILAAFKLGMSGQIPEAFPLYRSAIECSWYALHIAKDPSPPHRATIWLKRGDSDEATQQCKAEFTIGKVRATHETVDAFEASHLRQVYESTIDMGAHPNQLALFSAFLAESKGKETKYAVGILFPAEFTLLATLGFGAGLAVSILRVFSRVYPERFAITNIDAEINNLLSLVQRTFAQITA